MYAYTYICVRVCKLLEMEMDRRWRELIPFLERASCWELLQLMLLELKSLEDWEATEIVQDLSLRLQGLL